MAPILNIRSLSFRFPGAGMPVVADLDLTVDAGAFVAIVGGSGVGKSTLLRAVMGLIEPEAGRIDLSVEAKPGKHRRAIVFQDSRLLPWRTLEQNIAFGLEGLQLGDGERRSRIDDVLQLTELADFADRYPHQLSGGQAQRGGIARALAVNPDILLMDEPFSAVDAITRGNLQAELIRIWQATGAAVLFVTHDIQEAALLADRVIVMGGKPANIVADRVIDLPRPRNRNSPDFAALAAAVADAL